MAGKPRVHEIAREYRTEAKVVLKTLRAMGEYVKSPSSSIDPPVARRLRAVLEQNGHSTPVFPALDGQGGVTGLGLAAALPRRVPELIDLLSTSRHIDEEIPLLIEKAAADRWFFYSPTRAFDALQAASEAITALTEDALPASSGVAIIARPSSHDGVRLQLIAWLFEPDLVRTATTTLITATDADGHRLVATRSRVANSPRDGDTFPLSQSSPLRMLGAMWAILPDRLPPGEPREQRPPDAVTKVAPGNGDGTHIVYATRSMLGLPATADGTRSPRTSRWKVRGHWREQWYASEGGHRRIWIDDHTAGASDVDVAQRERVYFVAPRVQQTA